MLLMNIMENPKSKRKATSISHSRQNRFNLALSSTFYKSSIKEKIPSKNRQNKDQYKSLIKTQTLFKKKDKMIEYETEAREISKREINEVYCKHLGLIHQIMNSGIKKFEPQNASASPSLCKITKVNNSS